MGDAAWRYPRPANATARAIDAALRREPGVVDVVVSEDHVAIDFDPVSPPRDLETLVDRLTTSDGATSEGARHVVRVRYDGEDLPAVAASLGLSSAEVVALHSSLEYEVRLLGFLPGFAYLGDVDARLELPRRATPRARVAPASVALSARYTAIYPFASPGGWHLLGTAIDFRPFVFALGDRVRFEAR